MERTPAEYVEKMVEVFREVRRVLQDDGTLWLNLGDSYAGSWGNYHPNSPPGKHGQRKKDSERFNRPGYSSQEFLPPTASCPGLKGKDLCGIPWRVAFALQANGWWLRSDIIWAKPAPMPESVTDRPTRSHEYIFLLAKSERYYYDHEAVKEPSVADHPSGNGYKRDARLSFAGRGSDEPWKPAGKKSTQEPQHSGRRMTENVARARAEGGEHDSPFGATRNLRDVWFINTEPFSEAHFATFPPKLIEPCVIAGCPVGGTVLDPFSGAGTTGLVAKKHGRNFIGVELNPDYIRMAEKRLAQEVFEFELPGPETDPVNKETHSAGRQKP